MTTTTVTAYPYDIDMPEYELQTIHRGSTLEQDVRWSPGKMAASKREKKTSLTFKERFFGGKKNRKVSGSPNPKYDVVRSLDIVGDSTKNRKKDEVIPSRSAVYPRFVRGHKLEAHSKTSWCDACQELIWGVNIQAVRCQHCKYTVHSKCVSSVYLECSEAPTQKSQEDLTKELEIQSEQNAKNEMENNNNLPSFVKSISELRRLIEEYNHHSNLLITLHNDYTFDGFIRVHMNLTRPVNVNTDVTNLTLKKAVARNKGGSRRRRPVTEIFPDQNSITSSSNDSGISSMYSNDSFSPPSSPTSSPLSPVDMNTTSVLNSMYSRRKAVGRRLSFYMPKGTYKPLHVTSSTTVQEVIEALLSKYNVTDNPRKYCLFEKHSEKREEVDKGVTHRRLRDTDKPLILMLSWGAANTTYSFVMKEDEGGNIEWMNFEVPELNNFLKILQEEEDKLIAQVYEKYDRYREALENAMEPFLS